MLYAALELLLTARQGNLDNSVGAVASQNGGGTAEEHTCVDTNIPPESEAT
jgi:hypothetical protein